MSEYNVKGSMKMNKKLVCLLLALMMLVCMSVVGLAAPSAECTNGGAHNWEHPGKGDGYTSTCTRCDEECYDHVKGEDWPYTLDENYTCTICGYQCQHYCEEEGSAPDTCLWCGFVCTEHEYEFDSESWRHRCKTCATTNDYNHESNAEWDENSCCVFCAEPCQHPAYNPGTGLCIWDCGTRCQHAGVTEAGDTCEVCESTFIELEFVSGEGTGTSYSVLIPNYRTYYGYTPYTMPEGSVFSAPANSAFDYWEVRKSDGSWYDDLLAGEILQAPTQDKEAVKLTATAQWAEACVLTFAPDEKTDSGEAFTVSVAEGSTYTMPSESPFRAEGYDQDAWLYYDEVEGEYIPYFFDEEINVYEDMTFIPSWTEHVEMVTLTIDLQNGQGTFTDEAVLGEPYMLPPKEAMNSGAVGPVPEGKVFYCWQISLPPSYTTWEDVEETNPDGSFFFTVHFPTTVRAVWIDADTPMYTLTIETGTTQELDDSGLVPEGEYFVLPPHQALTVIPQGKAFSHWEINGQKYESGAQVPATGNMTAYAVWVDASAITYKVRFIPGDGATGVAVEKDLNPGSYVLPEISEFDFTSPEGKVFQNWSVNGTRYAAGETITLTGPVSIVAKWANGAVVTFDANGGEGTMGTVSLLAGSTYTLPWCEFKREGHNFIGWKVNGEGEALEAYETITVTANTKLVAQWEARAYNIMFSPGIGVENDEEHGETVEKKHGETFELPNASEYGFTCEGHKFVGWKDETNGPDDNAETYKAGEEFTPTAFTIFVAQWEKLEYTVNFVPGADGGVQGTGTMEDDIVKWNEACSLPECTFTAPEGYKFKAWLVDGKEQPVGTDIFVTTNMTVTAAWERKTYTVTIDLNGMTGNYLPVEVKHGDMYTMPEPDDIDYPESMSFSGWQVGERKYGPGQQIEITDNITVVAQWTERKVSLTYVNDAGDMLKKFADLAYGTQHKTLTLDELNADLADSQKLTAPEGYEFGGWLLLNTRSEVIDEAVAGEKTPIFSNWLIKASWVKKSVSYTLTLDMNGGDPVEGITVYEGAYFELPRMEKISHPDGLEFDYFDIGDGNKYGPHDFFLATGNVTAKAIWKDAPALVTYTITFDANGGSGTMADVTVNAGDSYTFPTCGFTAPEGKMFDSWYYSYEGLDDYEPGFTVVDIHMGFTLKAIWKDIPVETKEITITYDPNGSEDSWEGETFEYGESYSLRECTWEPPVGHEFDCWMYNGTRYEEGYTFVPETDMQFVAQWKKLKYTITFVDDYDPNHMDDVIKEYGDSFVLPECGIRPPINNEFKAWEINGKEYNVGDTITITGDVAVEPVWNWIEYTVTFDAQGGKGTMEPVKVLAGTPFTVPVCAFEAPEFMLFRAWIADDEDHAGTYKPGDEFTVFGNVTLKAGWTQSERKITYKSSDAADAQIYVDPIVGGQAYTLLNNMFTAPEGKMFRCWLFPVPPTFTEVEEMDPGTPFPRVGSDLTFIADWETLQYTVSFDGNGGSGSMEIEVLEHGSEFAIPACGFTAPTGMVFDGWTIDGEYEMKGDSLIIKGSVKLTAQWAPMTLAVNFEAGEYGSGSMTTDEAKYGEAYTLPQCGFSYDSENYVFIGWNLNGKYYSANDTVTLKEDTTFTAMWADRWYTFSYVDSNDTNRTNVKTYRVEYGESHTLPAVEDLVFEPKKEFHEFDGWMRTSDEQMFAPGDKVKNRNMSFKAMWKFEEVVAETASLETVNQQETDPDKLPEQVGNMLKQMQASTANADPDKGEVKIETVQDIVDIMTQEIVGDSTESEFPVENIVIADVIPCVELEDGTKIEVTDPADYPDPRGVEVPIPLPEGTSPATHKYKVLHMLTKDCEIGKAGDVEELIPHRFDDKNLYVWMYYFSPVATAYVEKPVEEIIPGGTIDALPQTGDPSSLLGWITLLGASGLSFKALKRKKK